MSVELLSPPHPSVGRVRQAPTPAKINLALHVLDLRGDGYHNIRSLAIGVDLCDDVRVQESPARGLSVECNVESLVHAGNLAVRAARRLAGACGVDAAARIVLEKRIPVGAGLGGGSSDAAATLRLCNDLWETGLNDSQLATLGGEIGSDVPLFFSLPAAIMEGRGERTRTVGFSWSGWVLLVFPGYPLSTADVYRRWQRGDGGPMQPGLMDQLTQATSADQISGLLRNDLEPAIFRACPPLGELMHSLNQAGPGLMRVSGSGSTLFRLFDDEAAARFAARNIRDRHDQVRTHVAAAPVGWEPVVSVFNEES